MKRRFSELEDQSFDDDGYTSHDDPHSLVLRPSHQKKVCPCENRKILDEQWFIPAEMGVEGLSTTEAAGRFLLMSYPHNMVRHNVQLLGYDLLQPAGNNRYCVLLRETLLQLILMFKDQPMPMFKSINITGSRNSGKSTSLFMLVNLFRRRGWFVLYFRSLKTLSDLLQTIFNFVLLHGDALPELWRQQLTFAFDSGDIDIVRHSLISLIRRLTSDVLGIPLFLAVDNWHLEPSNGDNELAELLSTMKSFQHGDCMKAFVVSENYTEWNNETLMINLPPFSWDEVELVSLVTERFGP